MKVSIKGIKQELSPKFQRKLDAKFAKLAKLLEKRGEQEAHVVVTAERHLNNVEITLPYYEHKLVGMGSDADLLTALFEAIDKLEIQAVKNRGRWRGKKRRSEVEAAPESPAPAKKSKAPALAGVLASSSKRVNGARRVYRVDRREDHKPMTLDEAVFEMEDAQDYLVYRDAEKDRISVLVRRRDGNLDLIEG